MARDRVRATIGPRMKPAANNSLEYNTEQKRQMQLETWLRVINKACPEPKAGDEVYLERFKKTYVCFSRWDGSFSWKKKPQET